MSYYDGIKYINELAPVNMNKFGEFVHGDFVWKPQYIKPDPSVASKDSGYTINSLKALIKKLRKPSIAFFFDVPTRTIEI